MTTERILTQDNLFALQCVVNYPAPSSPPPVPVQSLVVLFTVLFTKPTPLSLTPAASPPVPPTPPPSPREFQVPMDGSPVTVDFSGTDPDDLMRGTARLTFLNSVGNNCGVNVMLEFGQGYTYELEGILWLFPSQQPAAPL